MTAHLVALDPGLRGCGVAYFNVHGDLTNALYVRNPEKTGDGPKAWTGYERVWLWDRRADYFVSEVPQVYRAGASKGDPDDLLQLAGVVGVFSMLINADVRLGVRPREWKGQVPKDVHHTRIRAVLTAEEIEYIEAAAPPSLRHNVLDAVGIGLWWLKKHGIRPRSLSSCAR